MILFGEANDVIMPMVSLTGILVNKLSTSKDDARNVTEKLAYLRSFKNDKNHV